MRIKINKFFIFKQDYGVFPHKIGNYIKIKELLSNSLQHFFSCFSIRGIVSYTRRFINGGVFDSDLVGCFKDIRDRIETTFTGTYNFGSLCEKGSLCLIIVFHIQKILMIDQSFA